jgi:hypothetical protein
LLIEFSFERADRMPRNLHSAEPSRCIRTAGNSPRRQAKLAILAHFAGLRPRQEAMLAAAIDPPCPVAAQ